MNYTADTGRYQQMHYNRCGRSGLKLPAISLGLWHNFGTRDDYENMRAMCFTAFDHGINYFDLANNYGPEPGSAETNFGRILQQDLRGYRDELIISTKAGHAMWPGPYGDGGSRKYLLASLDQSLKRLQLDYVDIFYHHRPDPATPMEESLLALVTAVKSGKALYAGISKYDGEQTEAAMAFLRACNCPFVVNQSRYSIFDRHIESNGLKEAAQKAGCGIVAFSPLAQGLLSDKYLAGIPADSRIRRSGEFLHAEQLTPEKLAQIRALNEIASRRGQTLAQMALSWVLKDEAVTSVLIGASKPAQIAENIAVIEHTAFSTEEIAAIDAVSKNN